MGGGGLTVLLLGYRDIESARRFYLEALGFEEDWVAKDETGRLTRSHVRFGDTVLMLDKPGAHGVLSPAEAGGLTHLVVVEVEDLDLHYARAVAGGATILAEPHPQRCDPGLLLRRGAQRTDAGEHRRRD
jgi:uncharacterized glyoxalase superfamily protein PhnB